MTAAGDKFGDLTVIAVNPGRRATVQCKCQTIIEVADWALIDGSISNCGCARSSSRQTADKANTRKDILHETIKNSWRPGRGR